MSEAPGASGTVPNDIPWTSTLLIFCLGIIEIYLYVNINNFMQHANNETLMQTNNVASMSYLGTNLTASTGICGVEA